MSQHVYAAALIGVEAFLVQVEVDIAGGLPTFVVVGLPEVAIREARMRVQAAITNCQLPFPTGRITVNLAPAHIRKDGTGFDLPVALALLAADHRIPPAALSEALVLGELSLSGRVRPVRGILAAVEAARRQGLKTVLVAEENGEEASLIRGIEVRKVKCLSDAVRWFEAHDADAAPLVPPTTIEPTTNSQHLDLSDVVGQKMARRALEVAAAGNHNFLMMGGPGSGKTMLARRLPGILPPLNEDEAIEVTRIYSVAGLNLGGGVISDRPFRSPHHTCSAPGLIGGGAGMPRPGELTLAHRGVLFLDELPEFSRLALEVLRQPVESQEVILCRAAGTIQYPADVTLVAAMNPCPCGYANDPRKQCRCTIHEKQRYQNRVSGPLLDRVDIQIDVPPVHHIFAKGDDEPECSARVRERVCKARSRQTKRLGSKRTNGRMTPQEMKIHCQLEPPMQQMMINAAHHVGLSARSQDRILKVARTIADLAECESIAMAHLAEAMQYNRGFLGDSRGVNSPQSHSAPMAL